MYSLFNQRIHRLPARRSGYYCHFDIRRRLLILLVHAFVGVILNPCADLLDASLQCRVRFLLAFHLGRQLDDNVVKTANQYGVLALATLLLLLVNLDAHVHQLFTNNLILLQKFAQFRVLNIFNSFVLVVLVIVTGDTLHTLKQCFALLTRGTSDA